MGVASKTTAAARSVELFGGTSHIIKPTIAGCRNSLPRAIVVTSRPMPLHVKASRRLHGFGPTADQYAGLPGRYRWGSQLTEHPLKVHSHRETIMERDSFNQPTNSADAQGSSGESSGPAWGDAREPGQPRQRGDGGQTGDGDGASMRKATEDADSFGRSAADATQGYLQDVKAKASATVEAGKSYAQDAVNAAGKKIDSMKGQAADLKQRGVQFAAEEPMKAVAYAAACSAVVTAVLMTLMHRRR
jgi:hypothetical protein